MPQVQFDEDQSIPQLHRTFSTAVSPITNFFIKLGFKNQQQATLGMFGVIIVCVAIIAYIVFSSSKNFTPPSNIKFYKEDFTPEQLQQLPPGAIDHLPSRNDNNEKSPY